MGFWLEGELLYTQGHRLYVLQYKKLYKEVINKCHDSRWAGHLGTHHILALLKGLYYWPHMGDDVETYVKTCLVGLKTPVELLQPLSVT
ncbi:reverse transcriptase [Gossypium australe]|uniref:Reverse transcriptase n=1 Tax=Gossypium australe TaxID=47621 RepID=A0A5B6W7E3_9ROSI|nr:reverse transcriptase [Gossypium australe]